MKKYVISGIPLCETITGIPRYMYEVLIRLDSMIEGEKNIEIQVCYPKGRKFVEYPFKNIKVVALDKGTKKWLPQVIAPYAKREKAVVCDMADGFCMVKGSIAKIDDVRPAVSRFDSFKVRFKFKLMLLTVRRNANIVITVSESQKKQLMKLVPNKRIENFHPGWEHIERFSVDNNIFNRFNNIIPGEYYYAVGSLAKHKNFQWICEVAKRNPDKQFVVAGNENLKKWGIDSSGMTLDNVVFVGYVSDYENKALYSNCKLFLHPSFYEGFGLPPLEALSMHKNIAVSDIPEFRETYGDKVTYFNPYEYDIDLNKIKTMTDADRECLLKKYTWDETAEMWFDLLKKF